MPPETASVSAQDSAAASASKVSLGPVPAWVDDFQPDAGFAAREGDHVTWLLLTRQIHAELGHTFIHRAQRLETMQAVQAEAQLRLQFEPGSQSLVLHSISIRRGEQVFDHADLSKIRFLQREEGLDGFVIDGWVTLLLLLEDVRPKDILEVSYTIQGSSRILPDHCTAFFSLPESLPVAAHRFRVCFAENRPLRWKASSDSLQPEVSTVNHETIWTWQGTNHPGLKPEPDVPAWHITYPWIQISDCADWNQVATAIWTAWQSQFDESGLQAALAEIVGSETDEHARVEKVIRFVQDDLRYLSVNLELGGQIPASPAKVMRRRFGDCKDLSFLLAHLLCCLGLRARPVLVHTQLRQAIGDMLPTPLLFDHAVVEFQLGEAIRWIDATISLQGGGPLNRCISPFGVGLPIDATAGALVQAPRQPPDNYRIEVSETLLLDTTGADSYLAVIQRHRGFYADRLRVRLAGQALAEAEQDRLRSCIKRFGRAAREGTPTYRDDREDGEFIIAEIYRVNGFLFRLSTPGMCRFQIPVPWAAETLAYAPSVGQNRRSPLALPYPLVITQSLDIESSALPVLPSPRADVSSKHFRYNQRVRGLHGVWSISSTFTSLTDSVPANQVAAHLKEVEQIWLGASWQLDLPIGVAHPVKRRDFGQIPRPAPKPRPQPEPVVKSTVPTEVHPSGSAKAAATPTAQEPVRHAIPSGNQKSGSRGRRQRPPKTPANRAAVIVFFLLGTLLLFILLYALLTSRRGG